MGIDVWLGVDQREMALRAGRATNPKLQSQVRAFPAGRTAMLSVGQYAHDLGDAGFRLRDVERDAVQRQRLAGHPVLKFVPEG